MHLVFLRTPENAIETIVSFRLYDFKAVETNPFLFQQLRLLAVSAGIDLEGEGAIGANYTEPWQGIRRASERGAYHPRIARKSGGPGYFAVTHDPPGGYRCDNLPYALIKIVLESTHGPSLLLLEVAANPLDSIRAAEV